MNSFIKMFRGGMNTRRRRRREKRGRRRSKRRRRQMVPLQECVMAAGDDYTPSQLETLLFSLLSHSESMCVEYTCTVTLNNNNGNKQQQQQTTSSQRAQIFLIVYLLVERVLRYFQPTFLGRSGSSCCCQHSIPRASLGR
jgi:hypothetical protein